MPSQEIEDFFGRWSAASPFERANAQLFLVELCDLLGVPRPDPKSGSGYAFEFRVTHGRLTGHGDRGTRPGLHGSPGHGAQEAVRRANPF
jgi:hypothetical protein